MSATLTGISTIRASKASERLSAEFDNLQNVHSGVWQLLMSVNTGVCCKAINGELGKCKHKNWSENFPSYFLIIALGLWLDCVSCAFVACVCFSFIIVNQTSTTSSNVGLAISQALILTGMVQYGIREMMESFQLFTNTERILQYTKLEQEPLISRKPTKDWPFKGSLKLFFIFSTWFHFYTFLVFLFSLSLLLARIRFIKVWLNSKTCLSTTMWTQRQLWRIWIWPSSQEWKWESLEGS